MLGTEQLGLHSMPTPSVPRTEYEVLASVAKFVVRPLGTPNCVLF